MTKTETLKLAVEAGLWDINDATKGDGPAVLLGALERFANLVAARAAADERAKCALICESRGTPETGSVAILDGAANAIRARSQS